MQKHSTPYSKKTSEVEQGKAQAIRRVSSFAKNAGRHFITVTVHLNLSMMEILIKHKDSVVTQVVGCKIILREKHIELLNSWRNINFIRHPKGFLVAMMRQPRIQITIHYPDKFKPGELWSIKYKTKYTPWNEIDHRIMLNPVWDEEYKEVMPDQFAGILAEAIGCETARTMIEKFFEEYLPDDEE